MNKKILVIVVIAVVVVAVVVAGIYLTTSGGGDGGGGDGGGFVNPEIAGATSLQFSAELSARGNPPITYTFSAKNIGTPIMAIRVEVSSSEASFIYIVDKAEETAWGFEINNWTDISADFATQWNQWNSYLIQYKEELLSWTGSGDWTYTESNGVNVRIRDISVNPSLPDSLFRPS